MVRFNNEYIVERLKELSALYPSSFRVYGDSTDRVMRTNIGIVARAIRCSEEQADKLYRLHGVEGLTRIQGIGPQRAELVAMFLEGVPPEEVRKRLSQKGPTAIRKVRNINLKHYM